jgi:hypothetical protein
LTEHQKNYIDVVVVVVVVEEEVVVMIHVDAYC